MCECAAEHSSGSLDGKFWIRLAERKTSRGSIASVR